MSKSPPENPEQPKQKNLKQNLTPEAGVLEGLMQMLQPLVEFHKAVSDADDNDLRMFWDVRVVRGSGEIFITSSGSSSFPDALGPKQIAGAALMIQQEVHDKIAAPLVGKMQAIVEAGALSKHVKTRKVRLLDNSAPPQLGGSDVMDLADEIDEQH